MSDDPLARRRNFYSSSHPCSDSVDLFFGGHPEYAGQDRGGPSLEMKEAAANKSRHARALCMTCPLADMRECAQIALTSGDQYGVWAGVQLPSGQSRKIPELEAKRKILAGIADGSINPRHHPSNDDLVDQPLDADHRPPPPPASAPATPAPDDRLVDEQLVLFTPRESALPTHAIERPLAKASA